jgi:hypothetical protein
MKRRAAVALLLIAAPGQAGDQQPRLCDAHQRLKSMPDSLVTTEVRKKIDGELDTHIIMFRHTWLLGDKTPPWLHCSCPECAKLSSRTLTMDLLRAER